MKMQYCPNCARMDFKRTASGQLECVHCRFVGEPREGAMDEINAYKRSLKSGGTLNAPATSGGINQNLTPSALREKLSSRKGKKTNDFEIL